MRLWPFPKKPETESIGTSCDLPDGVVLALPDEVSASPTVPSYTKPDDSLPITDPAAGLEPPPSPLFEAQAQPSEALFSEDFQRLITPQKAEMMDLQAAPPPVETLDLSPMMPAEPSPFQPSPLPIASEIGAPSEMEQCESVDILLAQLNHAVPPPLPMTTTNLGNLSQTQPPLEASETSLADWALPPMETPALSSDWSLMPPEAPSAPAANQLSPEQAQPFAPLDPFAQDMQEQQAFLPMPSLSDYFSDAEAPIAPSEMSSENMATMWSSPSELTPPIQPLPEPPLMDALSPPSLEQPRQDHALPLSGVQPGILESMSLAPDSYSTNRMDSNLAPIEMSDVSLEPPNWHESEPSVDFTDLAPFSESKHYQLPSPEAAYSPEQLQPSNLSAETVQDSFQFSEEEMTPTEDLTPYDEFGYEGSENLWSDAEDVISESAELNSSSSAYDLNHYDDPDEPSQAIDLDQANPEFFSKDVLHSLNGLLFPQANGQGSAPQAESSFEEQNSAPEDENFNREAFLTGFNPIYHQEAAGMTSFGLGNWEEAPAEADLPEPVSLEASLNEEGITPEDFYLAPEETPMLMETMSSPIEESSYDTPQDEPLFDEPLPEPVMQEFIEPLPMLVPDIPMNPKPSILETLNTKLNALPSPNLVPVEQPKYTPPQQPVSSSPSLVDLAYSSELIHHFPELLDRPPINGIKPPSLSQAMTNFEEEMLLQETRFIRQSINNLVDRYFALQEPDTSF